MEKLEKEKEIVKGKRKIYIRKASKGSSRSEMT